jgi:hypothetical protein
MELTINLTAEQINNQIAAEIAKSNCRRRVKESGIVRDYLGGRPLTLYQIRKALPMAITPKCNIQINAVRC